MKLKDQFRFVQQNMKKNKTRVAMTILATAMGCAFLIVLASVGFGLHKSVVKEITEQRLVTQIDVHGKEGENGNFKQVTDEDIKYFETIKNVKAVTRRQMLHQEGVYTIGQHRTHGQTVVTHMPSEVKSGFELSEGRLPEKANEIIVGYHFKNSLFPGEFEGDLYNEQGLIKEEHRYKGDIIGATVQLTVMQFKDGKEVKKDIPLTVVGVSKQPSREWVIDQTVFISEEVLREVEEFTGTARGFITDPNMVGGVPQEITTSSYDEVKLFATNMEAIEGIASILEDKKYASYSVVNELKQVNVLFTIVKAGLIFIGTIAILIASIGIYNTMTMAVTERAPDIGIMKAIGANPRTIKRIFLLESSYIGIIGAAIGTIVSIGISYAVNFGLPIVIKSAFGEDPPADLVFSHIPFTLPLICITICLLVTILSGLRPAQRATRVDVLRAMRREV